MRKCAAAARAFRGIAHANAIDQCQTHGPQQPMRGTNLRRRQPRRSTSAWPRHREALHLGDSRQKVGEAMMDPVDHPEVVEAEAEADMAQACEGKTKGPWEKSWTKSL